MQRIAGRGEAGEGPEFADEMGLVKIAAVIGDGCQGCFLFCEEAEALLEAIDLAVQFWGKPGVLEKEFLQIA